MKKIEIQKMLTAKKGQGLIEYVLIVGLIAIIAVVAITASGTSINAIWTSVSGALGDVVTAIG